jgi:enoyl-CoA hydratase/carnithine racemase
MTQSGNILTSKDGNVAVVELSRLKKRNALSQGLIDEMIKVLSQLDQDPAVRAVVLTGSQQGPFCGTPSADLRNMFTLIADSWRGSCRTSHHLHNRGFSTWVAEGPERCS